MQSPVQITFRDIKPSAVISAHVEKRAARLEAFLDGIVRCHVVVEAPHRRGRQGRHYHVRVDLHVPGKELVVSKPPLDGDGKEDLHAVVDEAFSDAERVLDDYSRQLHVDQKAHLAPPHGVITKVFLDRGYGFIDSGDGHEVYFHRNSVLGTAFEKLHVGAKVRFAEEDGDKGPQASTVHFSGD